MAPNKGTASREADSNDWTSLSCGLSDNILRHHRLLGGTAFWCQPKKLSAQLLPVVELFSRRLRVGPIMAWTSLMPSAIRMALAFSFRRSSCIIQWQVVLRALSPFVSATLCNALLLESVPAMAFVEHKSLGTACSNSMPGTAGTVQPLDWTFTWNAIYAEQVWSWLRAGAWPFLHASWSCFEELCGRAFSTAYVTSLCLQSVSGSAVWIQTWRAPCPHSDTTRFWSSFQWISAPAFFALAASKVLWLHWVLAQVFETLKVCNRFVHKLSWPSTWDGQHFGSHLSCPCATCALNLAWIDCHCYRRGMNRYWSPRVVPTKLLELLPRLLPWFYDIGQPHGWPWCAFINSPKPPNT